MRNCKGIWGKVYRLFCVRSGVQWLVMVVVRELQRTLVQDLSLHFISPVLWPVRYSTGATALSGISKMRVKVGEAVALPFSVESVVHGFSLTRSKEKPYAYRHQMQNSSSNQCLTTIFPSLNDSLGDLTIMAAWLCRT